MSSLAQSTVRPAAQPSPKDTNWFASNWGLLAAVAVLIVILLLPTPAELPVAGHRMLAILAFAVIIWMTEAIDYAVSAIVIAALMAFLLGLSPSVANPKVLMGTSAALTLAFSGFANTALVLVAAALFLAAAMTVTGLDKRIALSILSRVGTETRHVVIGTILVGFVIALMVPSTTARVACLVPITLGIIAAFGVNKRGAFASMLMITTVQTASIWNVGIKTAAAQNMVAIGFIEKAFNKTITWLDWLIAAGPFAILMCISLYFVMTIMMPPEVAEVPGGHEGIRKSLAALGPTKVSEWKLLAISLTLIAFWATEGVLHKFDTSTTTITAVALMFLPGFGILTWKEAQPRIPWGTVVLFGVGISLGTALLQTNAATWLANIVVAQFGLKNATVLFILGVMSLFLVVIHLGFASATALASAMIPIVIAVLKGVATPGINIIGMTMLLQFVVSFGFILVVNAPQNMVAYGTETFSARDFVRTGFVLTVIALALVMLLGATYWHWLGYA
jgi:sodium-dependent dicarboxylate transporter 2/3/5